MTKKYILKQERLGHPAGTIVTIHNSYDYGLRRDDDFYDRHLAPHVFVTENGEYGFTCPDAWLLDVNNPTKVGEWKLVKLIPYKDSFRAHMIYDAVTEIANNYFITTSKIRSIDFEKKEIITQNTKYNYGKIEWENG